MAEPWETAPATATSNPTRPPASGITTLLLVVAAYFAGSYLPYQPLDLGVFSRDSKSVAKLEKDSWVIIVEETGDRSKFPWLAGVITDRDYWSGLKSSGVNWQFYDVDSSSVAAYRDDAKKAGLPALLVISPLGKVRLAKSCPPTTDSIDELLRGVKK